MVRFARRDASPDHADQLAVSPAARAEAETAESEKLRVKEQEMRRAMFAGYGTEWENADGTNDAQGGLTLAETEKLWSEWLHRHKRR